LKIYPIRKYNPIFIVDTHSYVTTGYVFLIIVPTSSHPHCSQSQLTHSQIIIAEVGIIANIAEGFASFGITSILYRLAILISSGAILRETGFLCADCMAFTFEGGTPITHFGSTASSHLNTLLPIFLIAKEC
jgi:hypothetical protein